MRNSEAQLQKTTNNYLTAVESSTTIDYKQGMKEKKLDPISIRLDADTKAALQELATADDRSLSSYVVRVLRAHIDAKRTGRKK